MLQFFQLMPLGTIQRVWSYYLHRVPAIRQLDDPQGEWLIDCPRCERHELRIDGLTGFWSCYGCCSSGDMYDYERLLTGQDRLAAMLAADAIVHERLRWLMASDPEWEGREVAPIPVERLAGPYVASLN